MKEKGTIRPVYGNITKDTFQSVTTLMKMSAYGELEKVDELLKEGVNINERDD
ncbi:hypothetical protein H1Q59_08025 [Holosporaceae bacterium 'Namur']|nr:hypothetical protein [Holosporaceae bacterium 'Namur']